MYLTEFDMQLLAKRVREELARRGIAEEQLPGWDGRTWPPGCADDLLLAPPPDDIETFMHATNMTVGHVCRMMRIRFDPNETSDWAFIPGERNVLLVRVEKRLAPSS